MSEYANTVQIIWIILQFRQGSIKGAFSADNLFVLKLSLPVKVSEVRPQQFYYACVRKTEIDNYLF